MKIVWSPLALERVEDIARYIAEDKPDAAVKWVDGLFSTVERLADFPKSGRMVPEVLTARKNPEEQQQEQQEEYILFI